MDKFEELRNSIRILITDCKENLVYLQTGEWKVIDKDGKEYPEKHRNDINRYKEMLSNSEEMLKNLG